MNSDQNCSPRPRISKAAKIEASKLVQQFAFIDRSLNLGIYRSSQAIEDQKHDLSLMIAFHDLAWAKLELIDHQERVFSAFKVELDGEPTGQRVPDPGEGVELSLLDRKQLARHRVVIQRRNRVFDYRHLLAEHWEPAKTLSNRVGDTYRSDHARRISGGRHKGEFFTSADQRQRLLVTQTGNRGYAFGKTLDNRFHGIFLHEREMSAGARKPRCGDHVTALLVQTKRGIQARSIRPDTNRGAA